jgi:hypothetical protein
MQLSPSFSTSDPITLPRWQARLLQWRGWFAQALLYTLVAQLPTLSPYRITRVDDMVITDSSLMLATGQTPVPASQLWGRLLPEIGTINMHYSPLYFYVEAAALRVFGFSLLTTSALHVGLRIAAALIFYALCRRVGLALWASAGLMIVWATFVHSEIGRPEDLTILLSVSALWALLMSSRWNIILSGVLSGAAFLCHPVSLFLSVPSILAAIWLYIPANRLRASVIYLAVTAATCALWLFWIVPFFHEFQAVFLGFALPTAAADSYADGLRSWLYFMVVGYPDSGIWQYSLIPMLVLLLVITAITPSTHWKRFLPLLALVALLLLVGRNSARHYMIPLISASVLMMLALAAGQLRLNATRRRWITSALVGLSMLIAGQIGLHVVREAAYSAGDVLLYNRCGLNLHADVFDAIPEGEAVLTNNPYSFYRLRGEHPVYWPGGVFSDQPSDQRFQSVYDDVRWLVLEDSVETNTTLRGGRFSDERATDYFVSHFTRVARSTMDDCRDDSGLSSYGGRGVQQVLALYERSR